MQNTNNLDSAKTQKQLASQIGMSVDTLQNYKILADMIPELDFQKRKRFTPIFDSESESFTPILRQSCVEICKDIKVV